MNYLVHNESFRLYFKMATSQSSTSSVRERLPDNCFLNLSDDDEDTLEQLQSVENTFFSLGNIVEDPAFIFILINHRSYNNPTQVKWFLIQI